MFCFSHLSKYRAHLMGIATILIIICHMPAHGVEMPVAVSTALGYGGLGCDMFLFLSGMGMWYSLRKYNGNISNWIMKRLLRVLIPYLLFSIPCFTALALIGNWTLITYILRLSTLSYWIEGWGLWFLSLILVLYLLSPVIDILLATEKKWSWLILLILVTWVFSWIEISSSVVRNIQFCVGRVPSFLLGFSLAENIKNGLEMPIWKLVIPLLVFLCCGIIIRRFAEIRVGLPWIEGMLLLIVVTMLVNWLRKCMFLMGTISFFGVISLESYCTNVFLLNFFRYIPWQIGSINLNPGNWTYYFVGTICCLGFSYIIHFISGKILKKSLFN